jgi:hypothetical protein
LSLRTKRLVGRIALLSGVALVVPAVSFSHAKAAVTDLARQTKESRLPAFFSEFHLAVAAEFRIGTKTLIADPPNPAPKAGFPAFLSHVDAVIPAKGPSDTGTGLAKNPEGALETRLSALLPGIRLAISAEEGVLANTAFADFPLGAVKAAFPALFADVDPSVPAGIEPSHADTPFTDFFFATLETRLSAFFSRILLAVSADQRLQATALVADLTCLTAKIRFVALFPRLGDPVSANRLGRAFAFSAAVPR